MNRRVTVFIPLALFAALVVIFIMMMGGGRNPNELKSVLIGRPAPTFTAQNLLTGEMVESQALLGKSEKPILVNFFASWCVPCHAEHENLMKLAGEMGVEIVGIAYKDAPDASRGFLDNLGDPYSVSLMDQRGDIGIEWGVSGVPETFIIDQSGIIRYRHWGPIVGDSLERKLLPELEKVR